MKTLQNLFSYHISTSEKENHQTTLFDQFNSKQRVVFEEIRQYFQRLRLYKDGMGTKPAQSESFCTEG
jgi:hypothetical protein